MVRSVPTQRRRGWLRNAAFAAIIAVTTPGIAAAESLADAMVSAYRHSALLEQNRAVLRAADEDVASAMARLRPVLEWVISHTTADSSSGGTTNTSVAALQAQMTLYDWGRSQAAIDGVKEIVLATRAQLRGIEQDVLLGAVAAYLDVRSARQQVDLQRNSVRLVGEEEQAAQDRFTVGEITSTDVAQAQAALAQSRAQLATAEGNLAIAIEAYRLATGHVPGDLSTPPKPPEQPKSVESAQQVAMRTQPAIESAKRGVAAAEFGIVSASAEKRPMLSGHAGLTATHGPSRALIGDGGNTTTGQASIGLELSQTLYAGGSRSAAYRKAAAGRDQARAQLLQISREVVQQVGNAWTGIDVAGAQIRAIDQEIAAAQQAFDGVREEAQLGARTTLDVLEAEQTLLVARVNRVTAGADLQLAHYQLLSSMGLLTVENLKLGIPTYDPSAYYNAVRKAPVSSTQGESLDRVLRAIGR